MLFGLGLLLGLFPLLFVGGLRSYLVKRLFGYLISFVTKTSVLTLTTYGISYILLVVKASFKSVANFSKVTKTVAGL